MVGVSSEKYYVPVLRFLLEHGTVKKYDLRVIVKSSGTMDKLVPMLEAEGLITVKEEMLGRRTYLVSLTPKGRQVAEQLKRAEEAAKGVVINEQEGRAEIPAETAEEWAKKFREVTKGMSLLYHVNVYEDHVTIGQEIAGKKHVINVYTKVNGKGLLQLWCEEDESFDCVHVTYAWTIPKVREMFQNAVRDGRVNGK
jgi:DNA-binding MarR family transcriptional regulator